METLDPSLHSNKRFRPELSHSHGHHGGNGYVGSGTPQAYNQGGRSDSEQTSGSDPGSGSMSRSVSDFSLAPSGPPRPVGPQPGGGLQGYGTPGSYPGPELATQQHMMAPHEMVNGLMQGGHMHQQVGVIPFQENPAASNRGMPPQQQQQQQQHLNNAFLMPNGHDHGHGHGHGQMHGHLHQHPHQHYQQLNGCLQPGPSPLGNPGMPNGQLSNGMMGHGHPGVPPHPHSLPMTSAPGGMTPANGFLTPTNGLIPGPSGGLLTPQSMQNGALPSGQLAPPSVVKWETPTPPHSGGVKNGPASGNGNGGSAGAERGGGGSAGINKGGKNAGGNGAGIASNGNSSSGNLSGGAGNGGGAPAGRAANGPSNSGGASGATNVNSSAANASGNASSNSNGTVASGGTGAGAGAGSAPGSAPGAGAGAPTPSAAMLEPPCAACKSLRRKCTRDCIFLPYFPRDDPDKFARVHKVFGASNVAKMLQDLPVHQREDTVASLEYEAQARVQDPVFGSVGILCLLQKQIAMLQSQLAEVVRQHGITPTEEQQLMMGPGPYPPRQ